MAGQQSDCSDMVLDPETLTRSVVFAVSLVALLVAHQVGDHVAQSDRQAARKADPQTYGRGAALRAMAGHLVGYHLTVLVVVLGTAAVLRLPLTVTGVVAAMAFSVLTHGLLDLRWPVRALLRATGSPSFAEATTPVCGLYAADQALHRLALLVSALLLAVL
jgi:Protein of unknown function (DUF3307)